MRDVVIIGGGVCGLALAHSLHARRVDWALCEARPRLGGRVLTQPTVHGVPLDLGPAWYWPSHQPSMTRLVDDLGLASLPQPDDGQVLHLHDPAEAPVLVTVSPMGAGDVADAGQAPQPGSVHGGARRLAAGMAAVVEALAAPLPAERLQLDTVLEAVDDAGDHLCLHLRHAGESLTLRTRRVVLALPPRVAEAQVRFTPALAPELVAALRATPTWMATAAKAAFAYERPFWRAASHTGNAWVTHPQAVLSEVFDVSPPTGGGGLAGFLALGASARQSFDAGLALLLHSQVGQLFGAEAETGELHRFDWAAEPYTAAPLDLAEDAQLGANTAPHSAYGASLLQQGHWQDRLFFGGTETARQGGGYLEGALSAAARLRRDVLAQPHPDLAGAVARAAQHLSRAALP